MPTQHLMPFHSFKSFMSFTRKIGLATACLSIAVAAHAADVKVLTSGAFKTVVTALQPEFEQRTGHRLVIDNDTAGGLAKRIADGEAFDLVVLPPAALDPLENTGKIVAEAPVRLARVAIGVAVKDGAPAPDVGSMTAFRQALLDARAVAYIDPAAGGSSGVYLAQLFERMGIASQIQAKAVLVPGGLVAQRLVSGEADLALHQISEILAVPGAKLVGPIPAEVQSYTVYAGAISSQARQAEAARAFLALLGGDAGKAVLKLKGMESP